MNYQAYGRIVIDERDSDQRRDSSVYAVNLYTNCNNDILKVWFCNNPKNYCVYHR